MRHSRGYPVHTSAFAAAKAVRDGAKKHERTIFWAVFDQKRAFLEGEPGVREICVNGAAAHLIKPLDLVIICSYVQVPEEECHGWEGIRIFLDERNEIR